MPRHVAAPAFAAARRKGQLPPRDLRRTRESDRYGSRGRGSRSQVVRQAVDDLVGQGEERILNRDGPLKFLRPRFGRGDAKELETFGQNPVVMSTLFGRRIVPDNG